jgi:hypothetical protein
MRRTSTIASIALLAISIAIPSSNAAIKSGNVCKKAGITIIDSGRKYTCVKQGKKLVWNKVVVAKTPTPTPSPKPKTTPTPKPTPTFIEPVKATSFSNLIENSDGLTYWAWKLVQERMSNLGKANVEFNIEVGPNTKLNFENPIQAFQDTANFYSSFEQVSKYYAIFYDHADVQWAMELDQKYSANPRQNQVRDNCLIQSKCNGGNAYVDSKLTGFTYIASSPEFSSEKIRGLGVIEAHEYFHTIQFLPIVKSQQIGNPIVWPPDWVREGSAQWLSTSMYFKKFEDLINYQKLDSENDLYRGKISSKEILNVLTINDGVSKNGWLAFSVGAKVMEIFVVLKGVDVVLDFYIDGSKGISFETSFEKIFGMSWNSAKPIIADAISKKYQ